MNQENIVGGRISASPSSNLLRTLAEPRVYVSVVAVLMLLAIPIAVGSPFVYHVFVTICLYGALATAWNIVGGYAGQLSLGHATFYGIGGYTSVLLLDHYKISPWISMWIGAVSGSGRRCSHQLSLLSSSRSVFRSGIDCLPGGISASSRP